MSKIKPNNLCSLCQLEAETIVHILFTCSKVSTIWSLLEDWVFEKTGKTFEFDLCAVILGLPNEDKVVNLILLLVKQYIFQQSRKTNSLVFQNIIKYLFVYYKLEEKLYVAKNQFDMFEKKWHKWKSIFET